MKRANVLIAWELGGNLGHIVALLAIARELRGRGHRVLFALRDLTNAGLIARDGFPFLPAPSRPGSPRTPTYASYAGILAGEVFPSANVALVGALAWRSIIRATRPDLLIADHAPIALLAARGLKLRTATLGAPFTIPVAGAPLPVFRKDHDGAPQEEARLLKRLNATLEALRAPVLESVSDLYRADSTLVRTLPELDCFGPRPADSYVSPHASDAGDAAPAWPKADGQKVLVYLKAGEWVRTVLQTLARSGASTVAYIGGTQKKRPKPLERPGLYVCEAPFKASRMVPEADVVVCHGNHGMVTSAALAGKPLVVLPGYVEQILTAKRIEALGSGVVAERTADSRALAKCWDAVKAGAPTAVRAAELGARNRSRPGAGKPEETVRRLEALIDA